MTPDESPSPDAIGRPSQARSETADAGEPGSRVDLPLVLVVLFRVHTEDHIAPAVLAERLSLDVETVEVCIAEARHWTDAGTDGKSVGAFSSRASGRLVVRAERRLRRRHRIWCASWQVRHPDTWFHRNIHSQSDHDHCQFVLSCLRPEPLAVFLRSRVDHVSMADIAAERGVSEQHVRRTLLDVMGYLISAGPLQFETWLSNSARWGRPCI
jgi:hypothetical protein